MKKTILKILVLSALSFSFCCFVGAMERRDINLQSKGNVKLTQNKSDDFEKIIERIIAYKKFQFLLLSPENCIKNENLLKIFNVSFENDILDILNSKSIPELKEVQNDVLVKEKIILEIIKLYENLNLKTKEEICCEFKEILFKLADEKYRFNFNEKTDDKIFEKFIQMYKLIKICYDEELLKIFK